ETVLLKLSSAQHATITDDTGVGTMIDHDPPPSLSIDDVSISENNQQAPLTVYLSAVSGRDVTVLYTTAAAGGATHPAIAGVDYSAALGTAMIPAGQTTATFHVTVAPDTSSTDDKTFSVVLSSPG